MKVACAQLDVAFGQPQINADKAVKTLRECKAQGVELVVFPECFLTGYCVSDQQGAQDISLDVTSRNGSDVSTCPKEVSCVWEECMELGIFAVVGLAVGIRGDCWNAAVLMDPGGELKIYHKVHLPELGFDKFAWPGSRLPVFETDLGKIGILICFDLRIPEAARTLALKGAELIVLPTNWPVGAFAGPAFMAAARAAENRVFLAACNRVGSENGFDFIGQSGIYSVTGTTLAKASEDKEEVIMADIDLAEARVKRTVIRPGEFETTVFDARHPELYGVITEQKNKVI